MMNQNLSNFPDINDEKYRLPDGWTFEDQVEKYNKFIRDVAEWKIRFEHELRKKLTEPQSEIIHHEQLIRKFVKEIIADKVSEGKEE